MITRSLGAFLEKSSKSFLLLGPRQTGKSTLTSSIGPDVSINLAHEATFLEFLRNPSELEERLGRFEKKTDVFIDEVQRLPGLLNTIQVLLDAPEARFRFYLTGSSARKLRRGRANLLPGRIHTYHLGPLTCDELSYSLETKKAMSLGTLPGIWTDELRTAEKTLRSYAATYLREEIQAESLSRNLEGFARFLSTAAAWSGHFLDISKMASSAQVARQSTIRFFEILEDSLLVVRLAPYSKSFAKRLVQHPKFYFFDTGVLNGLLGNFSPSDDRKGALFEHLVVTQLFHGARHRDREFQLSTYRTEHGAEVDVVVETGKSLFAVEIKASTLIGPHDLRGLRGFAEYARVKHKPRILYAGHVRKKIEGVEILPWQEGLREILTG